MKETTPAAMPPCFDRWCKQMTLKIKGVLIAVQLIALTIKLI